MWPTIPGFTSPTINVLIGAGIAMFSSAFLNWNQRRVDRDRFRRSLVHEVDYLGDALERALDGPSDTCDIDDVERAMVRLSPDVIDADPSRMSKLTSSEIEQVYAFYEAVRIVNVELRRRRDDDGYDPERLSRAARRTVRLRDEVIDGMQRSRLSRLTEWYKDIDRRRGS